MLSAQEESLISVVRAVPSEEAGKVLNWARQLADLAEGRTIEWSDSWTDLSSMRQRLLCNASKIRNGKTVEAWRCGRGRISRRARHQDSSGSGALDRKSIIDIGPT